MSRGQALAGSDDSVGGHVRKYGWLVALHAAIAALCLGYAVLADDHGFFFWAVVGIGVSSVVAAVRAFVRTRRLYPAA